MLKGTAATLKPKPDQEQRRPGQEQGRIRLPESARLASTPARSVCAGGAEDQRNAVQHEAGGKRAQQEILERGFFRFDVRAGETGQDVKRDGEQLERQEDDDQIVGRRPSAACR